MHFMMNFITILSIKNALTEDKDSCYQKLLTNRTNVPDDAFIVSSFEIDYEAKYARDSSLIEKAWCPRYKVHNSTKEFITIDLGSIYVLKMIMTKGLSRHGYKSASYYYIKYKIEEKQEWIRYRNVSEFKKISGNKDHLTEKFNLFTPSIVTRWIRIYPISSHPEMICLNLQLYGCRYTNNVIEYQMVDGSLYYNQEKKIKEPYFTDQSYDGVLLHTGMLKSGLGKLTDHDYEKNDNNPFNMSSNPFVGWSRSDFKFDHIHIVFRFINNRKFVNVSLRAANYWTASVALPKRIEITFSSDGRRFERGKSINHAIKEDRENFDTRWIVIDLKKCTGRFVSINLHFQSQWIMVREILFSSESLESVSNVGTTQPSEFTSKSNSTLTKIIVKSNAITITDIFLSSSISLGILFLLAICLICIIKWKRKSRIRKYKKAMHLQSQDEEYNRILTLQHQNMKNQTLYYPVANLSTLNTKFHTEERPNKFRQMIIPEAYNYWFYNDFCLDSRSNMDTHSLYNDATKYFSMEKNIQTDLSYLDVRGPLGNSQMYRMNLINFISTTNYPEFSSFHEFVKQLNFSELKTIENISNNSYGRIDVARPSIGYSPYEMEPYKDMDNSNVEGKFSDTVLCVRKIKQDSPVNVKENFHQELDNLNQINHKNLITFVVVQDKCDLASYVVNEYTSLMDIFTLLESLSILQSNNDLISIEQSQFLYIAVQLSDALSYLEYLGLVHRDIACRNILVTSPHLYIKLSDLAIAQNRFRSQYWEVNKPQLLDSNNKQNEVIKSPHLIPIRWMPWEVISKKDFSTKSDVYGFGVCMWELFNYCQQLPYGSLSNYQIFVNKSSLNSNIQPHQSLKFPQSTARETIDIIEQCLVDEALQRPTFKEIHIFFSKKNSGYKSNDALIKQLLVKYCCTVNENVPTIYFD